MSNRKGDHSLNVCPNSHQCPLTSYRKGDRSLNFCLNSHQCPNSPHSTVHAFKQRTSVGLLEEKTKICSILGITTSHGYLENIYSSTTTRRFPCFMLELKSLYNQ